MLAEVQARRAGEPQPRGVGHCGSMDPLDSRQGSSHSFSLSQFENLLLGLEVMQPGLYQVFLLCYGQNTVRGSNETQLSHSTELTL